MVKRCSVAKCYNSQMTHNKIAYFGYPKNETIAREWARLAGRKDLVEKKLSNLTKYFICSQHFSDDAFANPEVEDKSFLRLNKLFGVPIPIFFEDNLMQNVQSVHQNSDKFVNYFKTASHSSQTRESCNNILKNESTEDNRMCETYEDEPRYVEIIEQEMKDELFEEIIEEDLETAQEESEEPSNIDDFCRFCVMISPELVPIFNGKGQLYKYTECVQMMPPGSINVEDGLPQYACRECIAKLQSCANIIEGFVNNQSLFVSQ